MSCLVTLHAHQCSYRYPPFDRSHTVHHLILHRRLFALQSPFQIFRAQFAFDSTESSWYLLLEWLGEDSHMLEHIFVVWVTPNICAFSRPLFLLAYIQMQMPYVTSTMCLSSLPLPRLKALTLSLLTFFYFQLACCVGKVLQRLKRPETKNIDMYNSDLF